jgi:hypothetical protein
MFSPESAENKPLKRFETPHRGLVACGRISADNGCLRLLVFTFAKV